jgi:hypothetical protein
MWYWKYVSTFNLPIIWIVKDLVDMSSCYLIVYFNRHMMVANFELRNWKLLWWTRPWITDRRLGYDDSISGSRIRGNRNRNNQCNQ